MKLVSIVFALLASVAAFAGTAGFVYKGKEYIVYKDGEKVGKDFPELFPAEAKEFAKLQKTDRLPAAVVSDQVPLNVTVDGPVRCYRIPLQTGWTGGGGNMLQCVVLK